MKINDSVKVTSGKYKGKCGFVISKPTPDGVTVAFGTKEEIKVKYLRAVVMPSSELELEAL